MSLNDVDGRHPANRYQPSAQLRLGLDLDGVFADFNTAFGQLLTRTTGRDLLPPERPWLPPVWHWWKDLGYTEAEAEDAWADVRSGGFWDRLESYHAKPAMEDFGWWLALQANAGLLTTYFLTTRPGVTAHAETVWWLQSQFAGKGSGFVPQVIIANDALHKGKLAQVLGLDLYFDDYWINVGYTRGHCATYLVEQPYNAEFRTGHLTVPCELHAIRHIIETRLR